MKSVCAHAQGVGYRACVWRLTGKNSIEFKYSFKGAVDCDGSVYMGIIKSITTVLSALGYRLFRIKVFFCLWFWASVR